MENQGCPNEILQMVKSGLMACPQDRLPEGNSTEYPFPLSIHAAGMLRRGIETYASDALDKYDSGSEDAYYCLVHIDTAIAEASKLRAWLVQVDPNYLQPNIGMVDLLLQELAYEKERLQAGFDGQDQG